MAEFDYAVLDVFTDTPLAGNPVAVFRDALGLETEHMQRVARELNLSETVFLGPITATPPPGEPHARARIFTPGTELPFAGHPVLGTAFLIAEGIAPGPPDAPDAPDLHLRLGVPAGTIPLRMAAQAGRYVRGEMEQPLPVPVEFPPAREATEALGAAAPVLALEVYSNGPRHAYLELDSVATLSALRPDLGRLAALGVVGFTVYAPTGEPDVYRARNFAPGLGVPEDPATGSAAGPLAFHLLRHGRIASGTQIRIEQGVEIGRPSVLLARVEGTPEAPERVLVAGSAVLVARGSYRLG